MLLVNGSLHLEAGPVRTGAEDFARAVKLIPATPKPGIVWRIPMTSSIGPRMLWQRISELSMRSQIISVTTLSLFNLLVASKPVLRGGSQCIRRLIAVVPGYSPRITTSGLMLIDEGRFAEAEQEIRRSPNSGSTPVWSVSSDIVLRATPVFGSGATCSRKRRRGLRIHPAFFHCLGLAYHFLGRRRTRGRPTRRFAIDEETVAQNPRDATDRTRIAIFAARLGDGIARNMKLAQACRCCPDDTKLKRIAAEAYEVLGSRTRRS